jgi:hypothetical protein
MATASDPDIFINTTKYRIYFCTWFHYNLMKPLAKGNTVNLAARPENGLQAVTIVDLHFLLFLSTGRNLKFLRVLKRNS